jgi:acyl-CoA thioester hydrolase
MGVAHHASFVPWLEMGRTELLRASGVTYAQLEAAGVFLVITKLDLRFRRPARYDDLLQVRTSFTGGSGVKLRHEYEVALLDPGDGKRARLDDAGGVLVIGSTELACVGRDGKVRPLPDWLIEGKTGGPETA